MNLKKQYEMTQTEAKIEFYKRIREGKFNVPDSLKDKTTMDVIQMDEFYDNMKLFISEQLETRKAVKAANESLMKQGKKIADRNASIIDRVIRDGLLSDTGEFIVEFAKVMLKESEQPRTVREYISQLGNLAYRFTVEKFICDANPDMAELNKIAKSGNRN